MGAIAVHVDVGLCTCAANMGLFALCLSKLSNHCL